ncbi:MAG: type II toxin-antitoxin system RelE/ParE family toxin [Sphingomonas bacterium]|nr:type II toxin-antitoxin system RelE/ParE family toxin [Sphingomonas bacterium]
MTLKVEFSLAADDDLRAIYHWIADAETAVIYLRRIRAHCDQLADFPNRGTPHDDLSPGLRTLSFERRATIAYVVEPEMVRILRVLHKGRDMDRRLRTQAD